MAEVLGIAASIIAVIQLTAQATKLTYDYIGGVKKAPENLKKLVDDFESLIKVLKTLRDYARGNPESTTLCKLNDKNGPIQRCVRELEDLLLKLNRNLTETKAWRKKLNRIKWPLKEKETLEFASRLGGFKTDFILALSIDQAVAQSSSKQKGDAIRNEEKRTKVLNWLYSESMDKRHIEISGRRKENTGRWILRSPEVQDWKQKSPSSRLLWGYGIPGAGKTFLSSLMIDDLQSCSSTLNYGVAYIYFNFKEQDQQTPTNVLASIVKQLACERQHLPKELETLYDKLNPRQKRPTLEELYTILLVVSKSFAQTFIICDALDECDPKTQRRKLLPLFHQMENDDMRLFLTSREHPEDIQHSLQTSAKIKLWAKDEDITTYIEQKITENPRAERLVGQGNCKDRIISELKACANGMFLLVHFHIEYLCQQTTLRQILTELEKLKPSSSQSGNSSLDPTYDRAMEALRAQPPGCVRLASRILLWLVKARRTLSIRELQIAVAVEFNHTTYGELDLPDARTLLDVCASLVTVDETDTVRLAHYTVQEYLLRGSTIPVDSEFQLAMACTTFLSFDIFSEGACTSYELLGARYRLYPFLDYAAQYLSLHLQNCSNSGDISTDIVLRFLGSLGNITSYLQAFECSGERDKMYYYDNYTKGCTSLHVAAVLGHISSVERLLGSAISNIGARDNRGETALHRAAAMGHESVVRLLLEKGADVLGVSNNGRTALHRAAAMGHESVVRLLLDKGADILGAGNWGETVLHRAAAMGHESVVRLLLERGADVLGASNDGWTALHHAAEMGHESVVRLLLEKGADVLGPNNSGWTVLHHAAYGGHESVVRLLLEKGADVLGPNNSGWTVLHHAAYGGHESVVRLLLDKGADVLGASNDGWTALHHAAYMGHESVVRLLLEKGPDVLGARNDGWTALHQAAEIGHEAIVRLLIEKGADVLGASNDGETALHRAAYRGRESVVRLLLEKGADVLGISNDGRTALHLAALTGHESVVRLLLEKGADVLGASTDGWTALHHAAYGGHESVVRLLLEKGASASVVPKNEDTALNLAASKGHKLVVQMLLENGADVLEATKYGVTALHRAALGGHEPVVRLLLEKGADVSAKVNVSDEMTALYYAAFRGHELIVRLLLEKGASIPTANYNKSLALHAAASRGHTGTVKLLLEEGAEISAATKDGKTALYHAASEGHESVVQLLLEKGADASASKNRWTALHQAVFRGHLSIVQMLLDKGAGYLIDQGTPPYQRKPTRCKPAALPRDQNA